MKKSRWKRWAVAAAVLVGVLAVASVFGLRYATKVLKEQVQQALGPESEVGEIAVGWSAIEVRKLRIRAPKGWPAEDALRAEHIAVVPDLRGLFSGNIRVHKIEVRDAYISVLRARDQRLRLLPSLLEKKSKEGAGAAPPVSIGSVELSGGVLEFFDATVRQPPHKTRLEQLKVTVKNLQVPSLAGRTQIKLDGVIKGVQRNGRIDIDGWAELASKNSDIAARLRGVDLIALQPYLIKASETGVRRGTMDLDMKSAVRNNRLHAPGTVTLSGLELAPSGGALGTFMGVPREAVVASLKDKNGRIVVPFTLEGNLDDPKFSLNDSFTKRLGTSAAEALGISIGGLAKGTAEGLGGAVKRLFGK